MTKVRDDYSNPLVRIVTPKTLLENVMIIFLQAAIYQYAKTKWLRKSAH